MNSFCRVNFQLKLPNNRTILNNTFYLIDKSYHEDVNRLRKYQSKHFVKKSINLIIFLFNSVKVRFKSVGVEIITSNGWILAPWKIMNSSTNINIIRINWRTACKKRIDSALLYFYFIIKYNQKILKRKNLHGKKNFKNFLG